MGLLRESSAFVRRSHLTARVAHQVGATRAVPHQLRRETKLKPLLDRGEKPLAVAVDRGSLRRTRCGLARGCAGAVLGTRWRVRAQYLGAPSGHVVGLCEVVRVLDLQHELDRARWAADCAQTRRHARCVAGWVERTPRPLWIAEAGTVAARSGGDWAGLAQGRAPESRLSAPAEGRTLEALEEGTSSIIR